MKTKILLNLLFVLILTSGCASTPRQDPISDTMPGSLNIGNIRVNVDNSLESVAEDLQKIVVLAAAPQSPADMHIDLNFREDISNTIDDLGRIKTRFPSDRDQRTAQESFSALLEKLRDNSETVDVFQLMNYLLREAYLTDMRDVMYHAEKMRFYNEQKDALEDQISRLTRFQEDLQEVDRVDMEREIRKLRGKLAENEEDREMISIALQNNMQKQQQTMQTISNVSKLLHETVKTVINNMRV